jgi:hypothetical protein
MKPIATLMMLLVLLFATRAHAESAELPLVPSQVELRRAAHHQIVVGRSVFIAGTVVQAAGLALLFSAFDPSLNKSSDLIGREGGALILGTVSLVLIPVGVAVWAKGNKRERLLRQGALVF